MLERPTVNEVTHRSTPESTLRHTVFRVLETAEDDDTASRVADISLIILIAASVIAVILESVPSIENRYADELYWFEVFTISVFTVEYMLRLWSSVEREDRLEANVFMTRLRYVFSFHAIIDLLAILPFYLLTFGMFGNIDMRFLRAVRLLRVLKLTRYSAALNMLITTINENARALLASFMILITVMLLAASGMYYFERQAQPEAFGSIPAAMWWAFVTLTTVGYGDVTPITVGGRVFGAMITVVGIGMVALPTSILASGYSQQLAMNARKYKNRADEAWDDGVLSDEEIKDLEELRVDLGLGRHTASQILDQGMVTAAISDIRNAGCCPHCGKNLPEAS
ncbi:MAG: ion transporter [Gammaproteobacteria bacterium]|nr:ion transporter [Gammaproteobacteria bacterium]